MSSNLRHATLTWTGDLTFEGGVPGGPGIGLDGDGATGPSPAVTLLLAVAACSGADVVSILKKSRAGLTSCRIEVTGTRREEHPRRFTAIHLVFHLSGSAIDEAKAGRAIDLSLDKYCSVIHSLASDIVLTHQLVLG
jgi:putative redox protein